MDVVQERDENNAVLATYTRDGNIGGILSKRDDNGDDYFFHYDGSGNVIGLTDENETSVAEYAYDAYGNLLSSSGTQANANLYRYSTKEYFGGIGLYNYGYRFYSPGLGRWINRDPIEEAGGLSLYNFVNNSPVNYRDYRGLQMIYDTDGDGQPDSGPGASLDAQEAKTASRLNVKDTDGSGVNPFGKFPSNSRGNGGGFFTSTWKACDSFIRSRMGGSGGSGGGIGTKSVSTPKPSGPPIDLSISYRAGRTRGNRVRGSSVEDAENQFLGIAGARDTYRKRGQPDKIYDINKSKQNLTQRTKNRSITDILQDYDD